MEKRTKIVPIDGCTASTHVAYAFSEVAAIYPITPSTPMGEMADQWSAEGRKNIFGEKLTVAEMQSEGGAAGAIHGALAAGSLTTTFTASQGLLLMLPNMFKIAGELLPVVFHVPSRSIACQALSIFGDHSDVMEARTTGFAELCSSSPQEAHDLAIVAHLATLESRVPFLHFFDGFRTSHVIQKVEIADYELLWEFVDMKYIEQFRKLAMTPDNPIVKVGAENSDVYFQGREAVNKFYNATPSIVKKYLKIVGDKLGRHYNLFDYVGSPDAEKIIIAMGSSTDTIEETIDYLSKKGEKVGLVKVRLYRPFSCEDLIKVIPKSVKKIAVLDRTKEPGSAGEPLYLDVVASLQNKNITIIGGRYGLSSKEFTPTMVNALYDYLDGECKHGFTVGINDDVTNTSIPINTHIETEHEGTIRCKFWGLGSDGTVGANKNSIKIIGDNTDQYVQGYFQYDSKKAGGITISHLRFGKEKIQSQYLIDTADFVACHNPTYIGKYDLLHGIKEGGTFLLNASWSPNEAFEHLTRDMQDKIKEKNVKFYVIDAYKIAKEVGLRNRINTVMQAAFFKLSGVLPEDEAIKLIKDTIDKTFRKKGEKIVKMNWDAVDKTSAALIEASIPESITISSPNLELVPTDADNFAKNIVDPCMRFEGDKIPVSQMVVDGRVPLNTNRLEKRGIALEVPKWISEFCIQCNQCAIVCPHAAIRVKQMTPESLKDAPEKFTTLKATSRNKNELQFKVQVYVEDCTGCERCVEVCPTKDKSLEMKPIAEERDAGEHENERYFENLEDDITEGAPIAVAKGTQLKVPLFEFSGACSGCGETPYIKLVTQLFGDKMIIANATGCSSIYGGTFPTVPYSTDKTGRGPAWANSLFEDNAEFGFGMRLGIDANRNQLKSNVEKLLELGVSDETKTALNKCMEFWEQVDDESRAASAHVVKLLEKEKNDHNWRVIDKIVELRDYFQEISVWIIGGDGWAYDIGFGGLDHVLASGANVNVLVLDTEGYSNTGGQASKSTPRGAIAKFASTGKKTGKKNLALMMMSYGNVYVASCDMGAGMQQVVKAMTEAAKYPGPSLILAYSPCISHGIDMHRSLDAEKLAAETGYWPLFRFNPMLELDGKNPMKWESKDPTKDFSEYTNFESRYNSLERSHPEEAKKLQEEATIDNKRRFATFKHLAEN